MAVTHDGLTLGPFWPLAFLDTGPYMIHAVSSSFWRYLVTDTDFFYLFRSVDL